MPPAETSNKDYSNEEVGLSKIDPWLKPFVPVIRHRHETFKNWVKEIDKNEGGFDKFSRGYEHFGLNVQPNGDIMYREWAPNAATASLIGEFNDWDRSKHQMKKNAFGVWEVCVPAKNGTPAIPHGSKIKISMTTPGGERIDRLPAWIKRVTHI
jgi:1,4-alpha-glucan branching enzyme